MFQHHQINQQLMKCCISRNGSFNFKAITGLLVLRRWKCKPAMNADFIFWTPFFEKWCTSSFYIPSVVFYRWTIHRVGWSRIRTCNRYCVYQFRQSASRRTWDSNPHVCYRQLVETALLLQQHTESYYVCTIVLIKHTSGLLSTGKSPSCR